MNELQQQRPTAVLAAADTGAYDLDTSLDELRELAYSAGYEVFGVITQRRDAPDPGTFLGRGRLEELAQFVQNSEADAIIFDHELSPVQIRNIEEVCDCPVVDRTMLILDIFADRAISAEGKLQVELAQLRYQLPRLLGRGVQLSRQGGGGGGTAGARRGGGETKLETDRRHIRRRITALEEELEELTARRQRQRQRRQKDGLSTVAIVGYTNVGKSTLLNQLTQAGVLAEDRLFATLDPTARALDLPDGRRVMLIDTVGLVRRLPHHLVEAFKSTLEEAASADLILSVCDITSPEMAQQLEVTQSLLSDLGAEATPMVVVLNKCDLLSGEVDLLGQQVVKLSAKTGQGVDALLEAIAAALPPTQLRMTLLLPYGAGELQARIQDLGRVYDRQYLPDGVLLDAAVDRTLIKQAEPYRYRPTPETPEN